MALAEPSKRAPDPDVAQLHDRGERLGLTSDEIEAMIGARSSASVPRFDDIARIAIDTFGSDEKAQRWLGRPTTALSDLSPREVASAGQRGVALVVDLLHRIDHGLAV